ncbi:hypothetical protein PMAYCL1PPCAC_24827, partial [Pristionchus mayeri]
VLAVHSPVFKAMFYGDFVEKNKEEIELKDVDREFVSVLNLIYPSYKKEVLDGNAECLLKISDEFQIKTVLDQIEKLLISTISPFNVLARLNLSHQYRLVYLQEHCLSTFNSITSITDLEESADYDNLSKDSKATLLDKVMKL